MTTISDVSLRCLSRDNCLIAASHDGLTLQTLTKPMENSVLWSVTYNDSSYMYILSNDIYGKHLTFDLKNELLSNTEDKTKISGTSPVVKNGDDCLLLRLSFSAALDDRLGLELCAKNGLGEVSPVVFVREGSDQIFPYIDQNFLNTSLPTLKTIADIVDNCYDYVVIGSSFCSLAFIHRILEHNPNVKILVIEKGLKYLLEHYQHCYSFYHPGQLEYRPWGISKETVQNEFIENVHGQIPFFGGRSTYWSGWSPIPSEKELTGWPKELKNQLQNKYFNEAYEFLNVIPANKINAKQNNNIIYGAFQHYLKEYLSSATNIESVEKVLDAPLATDSNR